MVNPQVVLPILKRSMPKASEAQLMAAIKQFSQAHPDLNDMQFLAAMQEYMKQNQAPKKPFEGLMSGFRGGK